MLMLTGSTCETLSISRTLIKSVRLSKNLSEEEKSKIESPRKFVVKTVNAKGTNLDENEQYHTFDYIVVTSGQYSLPYIPEINPI